MCAFRRSTTSPPGSPVPPTSQPGSEAAPTRPHFLFETRPPFLSDRSRNARGVLIGGGAVAGAAVLGAAAVATALVAGARRARLKHLRGKTVLITGSSRGLGLAMAEEFARCGARLVLTARDEEELSRARALLVSRNVASDSDILVLPADLRKPEDAESVVERATQAWGQIDVLVNNAGIITVGPVESQTVEDFRDVMNSNFFSGLHCTLAVLPQMLARKSGAIVNIASVGGKVPVPHLLPYTASKFAAVGFSEGLHAELADKGVHVLTVCPGLMRTGSHVNAFFSGDAEREYRWFSLGATTPGVSTSARSAARKIVRALMAGSSEIAITPQAILATRLAHVSPELTGAVLRIMNRILPDIPERESAQQPSPLRSRVQGMDARRLEPPPAKKLGWYAVRRYNEAGVTAKP